MGEALLARGGTNPDSVKMTWKLMTEVITENTNWRVPESIKNGEVSVLLFGGGGSRGNYNEACGGGGGGWMNKGILTLGSGSYIQINIGEGGLMDDYNRIPHSGGTTFFGSWLSANGGSSGSGGYGGDGGAGGGSVYGEGGIGHQFGGGGSSGTGGSSGNKVVYSAASGGLWGGSGGSTFGYGYGNDAIDKYRNLNADQYSINQQNSIQGCEISGYITSFTNGIMTYIDSTDGVNRSDNTSDIIGCESISTLGKAGNSAIINHTYANYIEAWFSGIGFGGGGGWGGNGGNGYIYISSSYGYINVSGGGGGGFYGDGGDALRSAGGGGGGYGNNGDPGYATGNSQTNHFYGGGGGGYGPSGYGHGGAYTANGKSGICIIQYYQATMT